MDATFATALVAALGELVNVTRGEEANIPGKDGKAGYKYRYADLGDLLTGVRPILAKHGLAITQGVTNDGRSVAVVTTILHESGGSMVSEPLTLPGAGTPQAVGSAITYARRYQLMAVLGLASDDDDGQQAAQTPYVERAQAPIDPEREAAMDVFRSVRELEPNDKAEYAKWINSLDKDHPKVTLDVMTANADWRETVRKKVEEIVAGFVADDPNDPLETVQGELVPA